VMMNRARITAIAVCRPMTGIALARAGGRAPVLVSWSPMGGCRVTTSVYYRRSFSACQYGLLVVSPFLGKCCGWQ
jgi:hypothetical protein